MSFIGGLLIFGGVLAHKGPSSLSRLLLADSFVFEHQQQVIHVAVVRLVDFMDDRWFLVVKALTALHKNRR